MRVIFIDESGYTPDWERGRAEQPYYVLSAVCIDASHLPSAYAQLRRSIQDLSLPGEGGQIGRGYEIKAKDVFSGAGWWLHNETQRNAVRELMLAFPASNGGVGFVVVIDKNAHFQRYTSPSDPYLMSLQFLFERLEHFLGGVDDHGYCIFDHNTRLEAQVHDVSAELIREGSFVTYYSDFFGDQVEYQFAIDHIVECSLGSSKHSLGLQVADFYSTGAYQYYKTGKPSPCLWWDTLESALHRVDSTLIGMGLKEFP